MVVKVGFEEKIIIFNIKKLYWQKWSHLSILFKNKVSSIRKKISLKERGESYHLLLKKYSLLQSD